MEESAERLARSLATCETAFGGLDKEGALIV